jgi:hypothetical protein
VDQIRQLAQIYEAKPARSSSLSLSALPMPSGLGYRCAPPVSGRLYAWAPPVRGFFPQIPLQRVHRCAAGNPPLTCPIPSPQRLPPQLQGRATCVHTTSYQHVLSCAELSPRPTVPTTTALVIVPPQCPEPGARRQAVQPPC